jgi:hypothetical protein
MGIGRNGQREEWIEEEMDKGMDGQREEWTGRRMDRGRNE